MRRFLLLFILFFVYHSFSNEIKVIDISIPKMYNRIEYPKKSYSHFIQNLKLKGNNIILSYNGNKIERFKNIFFVIDVGLLFKKDIEQCADFAMRLWGDYHQENNNLDDLYLFNYNGEKVFFKESKKEYNDFLYWAFCNTNSHSIKQGAAEIKNESSLIPGDMVVQNETGGIGHVSIIFDVCKNDKDERLYLIGFSFMPAQEIHIEKAEDRYGVDGWFTLEGFYQFLDENYNFGKPVLRRF